MVVYNSLYLYMSYNVMERLYGGLALKADQFKIMNIQEKNEFLYFCIVWKYVADVVSAVAYQPEVVAKARVEIASFGKLFNYKTNRYN